MEVNADDLDEQVASARESLKESPQLDELKNYLLAVFNRARAVSTDADGGDLISGLSKNGRLAQPSTALSQGPLRRMLQRAVSGERAIAETLGFDEGDVVGVQDVLDAGGDVVESVLLESRESSAAMATYDPARRAVVLNRDSDQSVPSGREYFAGGNRACDEAPRLVPSRAYNAVPAVSACDRIATARLGE
jgi:hypothetical protein